MENRSIDYFTEQDLIDRYTAKRKNMPREDVEDLYKVMIAYLNKKLEDTKNPRMGFHFKGFCSFIHKTLIIRNLKLNVDSPNYKRAEEQLHHYLSGHINLKIDNT